MHESSKERWPRVPKPGARVALVVPAGPLRGDADVETAASQVHAFGWEPVIAPHALSRFGYLAGGDEERAHDLQWALDDPAIDVVWCIRGGFGLTRILDRLSLAAFAQSPKPVIGFSDVTALHSAIASAGNIVSFHGPFPRTPLPPMSARSFRDAVERRADPCGSWAEASVVRAGTATGRLVGGNLALLAALCGTPAALRCADSILVLEDVNEPAYRVDRMLRQLQQSGALDGCVGLAVGQFTAVPADSNAGAFTIPELFAELAEELRLPCLANLPIGHIDDQWTIPLGATATLDADRRALRVQISSDESPIA
jgi:muramoyltetrapeptide carboxypeptidase